MSRVTYALLICVQYICVYLSNLIKLMKNKIAAFSWMSYATWKALAKGASYHDCS